MDSVVEDSHLSETVQQQFAGTYLMLLWCSWLWLIICPLGFSYTADRMGESLAPSSLMSP